MSKNKNETVLNFERFKKNLGKYITSTKPHNKTKKEAASELDTSLSKYMAYEDSSKDYSRQTVPLDLLFNLAKRDRLSLKDLIQKIEELDTLPLSKENTADDLLIKLSDKLRCSSRSKLIEQLHNIIEETRSKFPHNDLINSDLELWIIVMLHNILLLNPEDIVELIYSLTKRNTKYQKLKHLDLSFNKDFQNRALALFIEMKKKEFND